MKGPIGTPWEGAQFNLELYFPPEFGECPPKIFFLTVPFHPNIDIYTGRPCLNILEDCAWNPDFRISQVLVMVQNLLTSPEITNAVNYEAAKIYENSPRLYEQLARDSVVASIRLQNGLRIFDEEVKTESIDTFEQSPAESNLNLNCKAIQPPKSTRQFGKFFEKSKVSFDTYFSEWQSLATSIAFCRQPLNKKRISNSNEVNVMEDLKSREVDTRQDTVNRFLERNHLTPKQAQSLMSRLQLS